MRASGFPHLLGGSNVSHIVQIQTEIRDPAAIRAACDRLRLPESVFGATKLFSSSKTGWAVQLPEWRYPVVCDVATGKVDDDNYGERWGDQKHLEVVVSARRTSFGAAPSQSPGSW
jgi:hypothetical protein